MLAEPAATAVTTPLDDTLATPVLLDDHVTLRPVSDPPLASSAFALRVPVAPTSSSRDDGLTATDATGTSTTSVDSVACAPLALAVMVAEPGATAEIVAELDVEDAVTFATEALLLLQAKVTPVTM
jgi:hypothetical protein